MSASRPGQRWASSGAGHRCRPACGSTARARWSFRARTTTTEAPSSTAASCARARSTPSGPAACTCRTWPARPWTWPTTTPRSLALEGGGPIGGNVTLGSGTLTITNGSNKTYAGAISGTGGLRKSGGPGAAQVLTGCASSYTGSTVIESRIPLRELPGQRRRQQLHRRVAADPANLVINGGTLRYTGATGSTNRQFTLGTTAEALSTPRARARSTSPARPRSLSPRRTRRGH